MAMAGRMIQEKESSGLDALAHAVTLGDNTSDPGSSSVAATTKHPRHRPGCSCIVCIQPPSGKGKHKSTCTCTVCMTVKRRFKTLMMRKKKRQSEQEAEIALRNLQKQSHNDSKEGDKLAEAEIIRSGLGSEDNLQVGPLQINDGVSNESGKGLDLNFHPEREEDSRAVSTQASLRDLLQLANLPLDAYMDQNNLASLALEQAANTASQPGQAAGETETQVVENHPVTQHKQVNPNDGDESCAPDEQQLKNDPS